MKKQFITLACVFASALFLFVSCDKEDDNGGTTKTKTELITTGTWKFKAATANSVDISNQNPPFASCNKDNILSFSATASGTGAGVLSEGATKCNPADSDNTAFTWNFASNETTLHVSTVLVNGSNNDFTLESITTTEMVLSFGYAPTAGPVYLIKVTFQH